MTLGQVKCLHRGDEDICSDYYVIFVIETRGEVVRIMDMQGRILECFVRELA